MEATIPAISLTRQESIPDQLGNDRFEFLFGSVPGAGGTANLTLSVTTTNYAGFGNEVFDAPVSAHVRRFRGRKTYPRTFTFTYDETVDFFNTTTLRQWNEYIVGTLSGNSQGYRADYSIIPDLVIYDTTGAAIETLTYWYAFLTDVADITVSSETSALFQGTGTIAYDYAVSSNVPPT
jgi:hypothetical protein